MKYVKEILLVFVLMGFVLSGIEWLSETESKGWRSFFNQWMLNGTGATLMWTGNGYLAEILSNYFPWTKNSLLRLMVTIVATLVYTFLAWLCLVWLWSLAYGWSFTWQGVLRYAGDGSFYFTLTITVLVSAFMHGRSFLLAWKETLLEAEQLKKEQMAARYEALKNQVNPHFLFNNFNVLATLVHKDADLAEHFIKQLSNVYRYVLDSREKELVPLSQELRQLEAYIFLMEIRFGESLKVDIAPELLHRTQDQVAPLTLQMLVENALKHNEASKAHPLHIDVFLEADDYVVVRNPIQAKHDVGDSTGVGLANISARYKFLSEKPVAYLAESGHFTVKIPLISA